MWDWLPWQSWAYWYGGGSCLDHVWRWSVIAPRTCSSHEAMSVAWNMEQYNIEELEKWNKREKQLLFTFQLLS